MSRLPIVRLWAWVLGYYPYTYNVLPSSMPPKFFTGVGCLIIVAVSFLMASCIAVLGNLSNLIDDPNFASNSHYWSMVFLSSGAFIGSILLISLSKALMMRVINENEFNWAARVHGKIGMPYPQRKMKKYELGLYVEKAYKDFSEGGDEFLRGEIFS